jgi:hypothetical protein
MKATAEKNQRKKGHKYPPLFFCFTSLFIYLSFRNINFSYLKKMPRFIGAIDQGTTSTRFIIFNDKGELVTYHQMEFEQHYPQPG